MPMLVSLTGTTAMAAREISQGTRFEIVVEAGIDNRLRVLCLACGFPALSRSISVSR